MKVLFTSVGRRVELMQAFRNDYGYFYTNHNNDNFVSKMIDFFMI